jgi:hypothetical protein
MPLDELEQQTQYDDLLEQHRFVYACLAILVEEGGGLVKIDKTTLETYDLNTGIQMWQDAEDNSWNIKVIPVEAHDA